MLKRSMASGFAGIENPLFFNDNTTMIFGDAKKTLQEIVSEFKAAHFLAFARAPAKKATDGRRGNTLCPARARTPRERKSPLVFPWE